MKLGITLWGFSLGYREAVDLASRVEEAGFHNLFMVESPLGNDGVTTVAMMAARTSRLLLGTNIANVYVRHARMLGNAAVAIDEVAPERLILGLGPNNRTMMTQAGFVWRDPREVMQETTATLRAVTDCKVAAVSADNMDRNKLAELASGHNREEARG